MRPQRFCLTIRGMMLAVAILGLLMGAATWLAEMRSRSASYRGKAFAYGDMAGTSMGKTVRARFGDKRVKASENENDWLRLAWATKLAEKYWRLADRPWLLVEPDPPPPERLDHPRMAVDMPADIAALALVSGAGISLVDVPLDLGNSPGPKV